MSPTLLERRMFTASADRLNPRPGRLARYEHDPVAFVHDLIRWPEGQSPAPYQDEVLAEFVERGRAAVRGPHGLGKTTISAWAVLWFATTRDGRDWKTPTMASAWRQLIHFLWPEIHKWARLLDWEKIGRPPFSERTELLDLKLSLHTGEAFALASDNAALIEGAHADHLLYLFDEAKTIPGDTFDAAEGAFSGAGADTAAEAFALATSTPGEPSGRFHEIHKRSPGTEDWWVRHVTLEEVIAAGRVSRDWAEQRARQWGVSSAVYQNRVEGEFASSDEDGVIPLAWVEQANERWRALRDAAAVPSGSADAVGVDVAYTGEDDTVMALRFGSYIGELRRSSREDTVATTGRAEGLLRANSAATAIVDVIGYGAGVYDQLRAAKHRAAPFHAGESSNRKDRSGELGFVDKRSAAWWNMRELLDPSFGSEVALPPDDLLTGDLTAPHWRVMAGGKIRVESKDDIRKRLGRSTDSADAVIQSFWPTSGPGRTTGRQVAAARLD